MNEIRNLYSVFSIQFLINHRSMGSDCVFADAQNRSYNTVSQALCNNSSDLAALPDGAKVGVPNDATNEARALLLLESNGLIKLKEDAGVAATKLDIVENPHNLEIVEMEAAQLPLSLGSLDIAVINGNYALSGGLSISDALAIEEADSLAAETYQNVVAVRNGDETRTELQTLIEVLNSQEIADYINETFEGAVAFEAAAE